MDNCGAAKHVRMPVKVPDCCVLIRIHVPKPSLVVSEAGQGVFRPAGLNLIHPTESVLLLSVCLIPHTPAADTAAGVSYKSRIKSIFTFWFVT